MDILTYEIECMLLEKELEIDLLESEGDRSFFDRVIDAIMDLVDMARSILVKISNQMKLQLETFRALLFSDNKKREFITAKVRARDFPLLFSILKTDIRSLLKKSPEIRNAKNISALELIREDIDKSFNQTAARILALKNGYKETGSTTVQFGCSHATVCIRVFPLCVWFCVCVCVCVCQAVADGVINTGHQ